ncbi:MAG: ABC transporter substrate-binding protein [Bacillota bacterium]
MKIKKRSILLVVLIILVISGVGQAGNYPVEVTDDLGTKTIIESKPQRIVSLAPSHTETLFALGLKENIVGITDHANYPQGVSEIERVGTIKEANIEKIVDLKPDLVFAAAITPKKIINRLQELNIDVIGLKPQSIEGIIEDISLIARLTGQAQRGAKITTTMRSKLQDITTKIEENISSNQRPKVFYEVWKEPLYTAGPNTFIDDLINLAGGANIAHDAQGEWPQYNFEVLLAKNPDVYLASKHSWNQEVTKDSIQQRDNFQAIKGIKEGRILVLNPDIVNRTSPRIISALEEIAKVIHPQLF